MKREEQLNEWVAGTPMHNFEYDECCPDFSCCTGVIAEKSERERFAKAYYEHDDETANQMLMIFLGRLVLSSSNKVYLAGQVQEGALKWEQ